MFTHIHLTLAQEFPSLNIHQCAMLAGRLHLEDEASKGHLIANELVPLLGWIFLKARSFSTSSVDSHCLVGSGQMYKYQCGQTVAVLNARSSWLQPSDSKNLNQCHVCNLLGNQVWLVRSHDADKSLAS